MKWLAASLVVLACSVGCHAPKPSFNVLAPYGSSRVPPPATSSTAGSTPYYNQSSIPAASASGNTGTPAAGQRADATNPSPNPSLASSEAWRSAQMNSASDSGTTGSSSPTGVTLTTFNAPVSAAPSSPTAADSQDNTSLKLGGMPVNDATQPANGNPPATFVPAAGASPISALPAPPTMASSNTVVATAKASDQTNSGASVNGATGGQATLQWKNRY